MIESKAVLLVDTLLVLNANKLTEQMTFYKCKKQEKI